ncbi:MAG TPA: glycosyl hydrolase-related protein [Gemmatimonadales bacterium]|nr:glycosyl hydrolase-related protein [Gemmatimonadales bacterium]
MAGRVIHLIPHTHWDREWYLTRAGFLARLVPVMDDLLDRLEAEPDFRSFLLDGQTVLVADYLAVRPEQRHRVEDLVRTGRLQVGPWYVLADELIPSGESLVRNLLAGTADAERLGGRLGVLYCPDAFGHPAILPALAAEFGLGYALLWRGVGGEPGQAGDLYRWRAPDGREVVVYHLPPDGYEIGAALPSGWEAVRAGLLERATTSHVGVMVGADHHAAHPALGQARDTIARREPAGTAVVVSRLDEFLSRAAAEALDPALLEGELRWSYGYTWTLQGVHGTRAALKRRHSLAELALERVTEPLAALALARGASDPRPLLSLAWRTLLRSQFHDSIAGCTSDAVSTRVEARIEDAATIAEEVSRQCVDALLGNDPDLARELPERAAPALVAWNPVARRRDGVVVTDLTWLRRDVLIGYPGARVARTGASPSAADIATALGGLPFQELGRAPGQERLDAPHHYPDQDEVEVTRVALRMPPVGGLGFHIVGSAPGEHPSHPPDVTLAGTTLQNGILRVAPAPDGTIDLTDLRTGVRHRRLLVLESEADLGDTYSYAAPAGGEVHRPGRPFEITALASGPLVGAIALRAGLSAGRAEEGIGPGWVGVRIILSLYAGSPALRCTLELHNGARDHRLRLRLPGAAPADAVLAGGPFGPVTRQPVVVEPGRYSRETPVPTAPAHRFVAGPGLALLAPGFFEYEHTPGGDLLLTLIRAIGRLSAADLPTRPGHAAWPTPTPLAQSPGRERLQVALLPLLPGVSEDPAAILTAWEDVFLPLRAVWLRQATRLDPPRGALELEGAGLVMSAVKPAAEGDGLVLRCYNGSAAPVAGCWRLPFAAEAANRVRSDEREPRPVLVEDGGRTLRFTAGPREIVTFLLESGPVPTDT